MSTCLETDKCKCEMVADWTLDALVEDPTLGTPEAVSTQLTTQFTNMCTAMLGGN